MDGRIVVTIASETIGGIEALYATAAWFENQVGEVEPKSLASARILLSTRDWSTMDIPLFRLLHSLDGKLAEREMQKVKNEG
jgi:hypothetical protein